jgi:hypothetical protein
MSDLPDGTYNFLITALDNQGYGVNVLLSPAVVIDTTGPTLTAGKSVSGTTASRGIVFSGTVSDSAGVDAVEIYDTNGSTWTNLGSAAISGTTWQLTNGHLAPGAHNFIAVAIDSLSNVRSAASAGRLAL